MAQLAQLAAPLLAPKAPAAHDKHRVAAATEYVLGAQLEHAFDKVAPRAAENAPAGQLVQLGAPTEDW
jgi:hypothetical protein